MYDVMCLLSHRMIFRLVYYGGTYLVAGGANKERIGIRSQNKSSLKKRKKNLLLFLRNDI